MTETLLPHGLVTQAYGENPGSWHVPYNENFAAINSRLPRSREDDPNGKEVGLYVGQRIFVYTAGINFICTTAGDAVTAVWTPEVTYATVPLGGIIMFSGDIGDIAFPWALCDGNNGTPNLQDKFIVGAGDSYAVGDTGGNDAGITDPGGDHDHGGATQSHTLTIDQIPSHTHSDSTINRDTGTGSYGNLPVGSDLRRTNVTSGATGGGQAHSHNITTSGDHTHTFDNRPQFYALAYIQRVA